MKTRKIFLAGILLAFLTANVNAEMPEIIQSTLRNLPEDAVAAGVGTASNATLAQIFARADLASQLRSEVQSAALDRSILERGLWESTLSAVNTRNTIVSFSEVGLRHVAGGNAGTQGVFVVSVTDYQNAVDEKNRLDFHDINIRIGTVPGRWYFRAYMASSEFISGSFTESIKGLDTAGRDWEFITGQDGIHYWIVVESRDTNGYYWALVIRLDFGLSSFSNRTFSQAVPVNIADGLPRCVYDALWFIPESVLRGIGVAL